MSPPIERDRIERRLDALHGIGRTDDGGVTRLAYTEEENEAFEYLRGELPAEWAVTVDSIGNLFATPAPDAPRSVYLGSHLDSVFNGGRLDGTLGVVAALEAIQAVEAMDAEPASPPTLAVFRGEESARFGQHTIGSRGALGMLTVEDFAATDGNDVPLWHAMQQAGFRPANLSEESVDLDRVVAFLELHIEQGRVLDEGGDDVGVVTSIRAPVRHRVTVTGHDDHSGATPMDLRRDALVAAAEMIVAVESIGRGAAEEGDAVATVGEISAVGGAINKVCGEVTFPIDLRSTDRGYRDAVEERLLDELDAIAADRGVEVETIVIDRSDPVTLDDGVIEALDAAAASVGGSHRRLPSGGGHDAMNFQGAGVPTGMLFVPSVDGVSHSPAEETDPAAVEAATATLARALLDGPTAPKA